MKSIVKFLFLVGLAATSSVAQAESCSTPQLQSLAALMGNLKNIQLSCGRYPAILGEIFEGEGTEYAQCAKQYLSSPPVDPLGSLYRYELDESHWYPVFLSSPGVDKRWGTKDDVTNRMPDGEPLDSFSTDCGIKPEVLHFISAMILLVTALIYIKKKGYKHL